MRVEVQRTGGFAGRAMRWSVVVEELPAAAAEELLSLLAAAGASTAVGPDPSGDAGGRPGSSRGADRFQWRLQTSGFPQDVDLVFNEPVPEPARRLVDVVRHWAPGPPG